METNEVIEITKSRDVETWEPQELERILVYSEKGELIGEFPRYAELISGQWSGKEMPVCPNCQKYDDCLREIMEVVVATKPDNESQINEKNYISKQCKHCGHHFLRLTQKKGSLRRDIDNSLVASLPEAVDELCKKIIGVRDFHIGLVKPQLQNSNLLCTFCSSDSPNLGLTKCEDCGIRICEEHRESKKKYQGIVGTIIEIIPFLTNPKRVICPECL